jgi:hypothetical protein
MPRRPGPITRQRAVTGASQHLSHYAQLIRNPFLVTPMQLGWGCLLPSTIITSRYQLQKSLGTTGSAMFFTLPNLAATYNEIDSSMAASAFSLRYVQPDSARNQFQNVFSQLRPVAFGMVVRTLQSATQSIPRVYGGYMTDSVDALNSNTNTGSGFINNIVAGSYCRPLDPTRSNIVCGLPMDPEAFGYSENYLNAPVTLTAGVIVGSLGVDYFAHSIPWVVVYNTDAASINIQIDIVCHYEALSTSSVGTPLIEGTRPETSPGATSDAAMAIASTLFSAVAMGTPYSGAITAGSAVASVISGAVSGIPTSSRISLR